jgi:hypothetical protein
MVGRTKCRARQELNTSPTFGWIAVFGLHVRARYDHQSPIMPGLPVYTFGASLLMTRPTIPFTTAE